MEGSQASNASTHCSEADRIGKDVLDHNERRSQTSQKSYRSRASRIDEIFILSQTYAKYDPPPNAKNSKGVPYERNRTPIVSHLPKHQELMIKKPQHTIQQLPSADLFKKNPSPSCFPTESCTQVETRLPLSYKCNNITAHSSQQTKYKRVEKENSQFRNGRKEYYSNRQPSYNGFRKPKEPIDNKENILEPETNVDFKIAKTSETRRLNYHLSSKHAANSENRIFQTEDSYNLKYGKYKAQRKQDDSTENFKYKVNRKARDSSAKILENIDTCSVTTENIRHIVDKEIELHRRKKLKHYDDRMMRNYNNYEPSYLKNTTNSHSHCLDHRLNYLSLNNSKSILKSSSTQTDPVHNLITSPSDNIRYLLTSNHIHKISDYLKMDLSKLTNVIDSVVAGCQPNPDDDDDDGISVIDSSQSPVQRRYKSFDKT